jgi:hypothetical protein
MKYPKKHETELEVITAIAPSAEMALQNVGSAAKTWMEENFKKATVSSQQTNIVREGDGGPFVASITLLYTVIDDTKR